MSDASALAALAQDPQRLNQLIERISNPSLSPLEFAACAELLRSQRRHAPRQAVPHRGRRADPILQHAVGRIVVALLSHTNGANELRHRDAAATLCLPPTHFTRLLKGVTGLTFTEWRMVVRVQKFVVCLAANPDEHIRQIAFRCGYQHPTHLCRDFRRLLGISPRVFRRLHAAGVCALT
jgi:AraC-like DNA-binding protein